MPSASSCLLHVFGFAEYPYQTESKRDKTDGAYFWKIWKIQKENQREPVPEVVTRQGGAPLRARPYPREPTVRRLTLFFCRKKANIRKKITAKVSGQSELRISIYIRKGETELEQNAEPKRNREIDPISEGLSPLPCHGGQGPEGKPFSHLGRRSMKKRKKGPPLSLSSGGAGTPFLMIRRPPRSTPTPPPSSPTSPSPSPLYLQRSTLPQPAVPST